MQADVLVRIKVIRSENRDAMDAVGFKSENRPCPIPLVNKNYPILSQNKKLKFQNHPNIMLSLYPIHPQLSSGDSYDFPPFSNGKIPNCWESTGGNPQHTWNIAIVKPQKKKSVPLLIDLLTQAIGLRLLEWRHLKRMLHIWIYIWGVSINGGVPQNDGSIMETSIKWMICGYPHFRKTYIYVYILYCI